MTRCILEMILYFLRHEDGVETVEWIGLAAIMIVMLAVVVSIFRAGGQSLAQTIIDGILYWIKPGTP